MTCVLHGWQWLAGLQTVRFGSGVADVAARAPKYRPVYLATPYSKRVLATDGRWESHLSMVCALEAAEEAADLMRRGITALSPIVQAHLMVMAVGDGPERIDPMDQALWGRWCRPILEACGSVFVPACPGWAESEGVLAEVSAAVLDGKPVFIATQALPGVAA